MEKLHDEYLAGVGKNGGKLPVVAMTDTVAVESGDGAKKSTNYHPVFEIVSWVARPRDLGKGAAPAEVKKAAPPATGSTRAPAPVQRTPEPDVAEDEDFG